MGWDLIVLRVPDYVKAVADLRDHAALALGSRDDVLRTISAAFPQADTSNPVWVVVDGEGYTLELNIGEKEPIESLMIFVHGSAEAIRAIEHLCVRGGWRAFDTAAGDFIDFASTNRDFGFERSQEYRRHIHEKYRDG